MGDISDMYREMEFDYGFDDEFSDDREEELAARGIWPARDGDIQLAKMGDEHILNAISYIKRKNPNSPLCIMLEREFEKRHRK